MHIDMPEELEMKNRFVVKNQDSFYGRTLAVVVDRQTGVNYATFLGPQGAAALTPLLDKDGKPLVDELPIEND